MLKTVGALMVISCCTIIGLGFAGGMKTRKKSLAGLISALTIMESEICDLLTPMPELLEMMAVQSEPPVRQFFVNCLGYMKNGTPFSRAWEKAIRQTRVMQLNPDEILCLCELGMSLGKYEAEQQRSAIKRTLMRLENYHKQAEEDLKSRGKICAAMGVSAGVMIAIIVV